MTALNFYDDYGCDYPLTNRQQQPKWTEKSSKRKLRMRCFVNYAKTGIVWKFMNEWMRETSRKLTAWSEAQLNAISPLRRQHSSFYFISCFSLWANCNFISAEIFPNWLIIFNDFTLFEKLVKNPQKFLPRKKHQNFPYLMKIN